MTPSALTVTDDGRGFDPARREQRREEGHVGLTLLEDLARRGRRDARVRSQPGAGTTVEMRFER